MPVESGHYKYIYTNFVNKTENNLLGINSYDRSEKWQSVMCSRQPLWLPENTDHTSPQATNTSMKIYPNLTELAKITKYCLLHFVCQGQVHLIRFVGHLLCNLVFLPCTRTKWSQYLLLARVHFN